VGVTLERPTEWAQREREGTRRRIWAVVLVALFCTSGSSGVASDPPPVSAGAPLTRGQIVAALGERNPKLSQVTSDRIAASIERCEEDQGLSRGLVLAVLLHESDARPEARSPKGAIGLMQVMPHMFAVLRLPGGVGHIESNVEAGCLLLADNIRRLGEDRGILAYFWGSAHGNDAYLRNVRAEIELLRRVEPADDDSRGRG